MKRALAIVAVVALLALAGCSGADTGSSNTTQETETPDEAGVQAVENAEEDRHYGEIRAYYDEEGQMVCFTFRDGGNAAATGGIDCEPINETAYEPEDFE